MINDKATASGAPPARSCDVCALPRGTPATLLQDGLCWGDGHNALLNEQCLRRGYERQKAAREAAEKALDEERRHGSDCCLAWDEQVASLKAELAEERRGAILEAPPSTFVNCRHARHAACRGYVPAQRCACSCHAEGTAARSAAPKGLLEEGEGK